MTETTLRPSASRYQSLRVFENSYLERLTHVHPITPLVVWLPVVVGSLSYSFFSTEMPIVGVVGVALLGLFFWTLTEYVLHRYLFHFQFSSRLGKRFHFIIHGLHHDDPNDPTRLVMPPAASIILGVLFFFGFRLLLGESWVFPFFGGFILGYLIYDYTHYAIHFFSPKTAFGKWVKRCHMNHHFVNSESLWGVSSPLWDRVFGTYETKK